MHLLIPFAAPLSEAGRAAAASLQLPHLQRLLASWSEVRRDEGDELSWTPPHERALAHALGWECGNGVLPWAARSARADGVAVGDQAWGLVTPVHWHLGTDQISMLDPEMLMLDAATSRIFFDAVVDLFTSEGFVMQWGAPQRWYLADESLATMATASLDRVIGRNVDAWLGDSPAMRRLRRLQNEVQMQLYTHPANDQRESQGLLTVNSFWLSGCGIAQAVTGPEPQVDERLRGPALADDWAAWVKAWETLDEGPLAHLLREPIGAARLTLCGERSSASFEPVERPVVQRLRAWWRTAPSPQSLLETL
ncbi:MAG TPA: hypothetical protein VK439_15910 [Rubrivivax sp.]|nr:hypothetical protein [Rubrivivax sp.]